MRCGIRALAALAMASAMALCVFTRPALAAEAGFQPPPGGWVPTAVRDEPVRKAARFALQEQAKQSQQSFKLLSIKHARLFAMEGMHYSMNLLVQAEGERRLVIAVVWMQPDGSMQLTRWHWV